VIPSRSAFARQDRPRFTHSRSLAPAKAQPQFDAMSAATRRNSESSDAPHSKVGLRHGAS
jgi:hypothetical protein